MTDNKEKDEISGIETTGHEWDGLKELNNPAPRWWLWVFFLCCLWSVGYWILYPAWPTLSGEGERGGTKGKWEWTQYKKLQSEQAEIKILRGERLEKIKAQSVEEIQNDPELYAFAVAGGRTAFRENCAACHGTGAQGAPGYPNLNDDDWLWGGDLASLYQTIRYGIRSGHEQARDSAMPNFGKDSMLDKQQIEEVTPYVMSLSGMAHSSEAGKTIYAENCAMCHGDKGEGNRELGAPNLADAIWLYGNDKNSIATQVNNPRHGIMPAWESRLPDATIKQLTIYVHSLGGGEASPPTK